MKSTINTNILLSGLASIPGPASPPSLPLRVTTTTTTPDLSRSTTLTATTTTTYSSPSPERRRSSISSLLRRVRSSVSSREHTTTTTTTTTNDDDDEDRSNRSVSSIFRGMKLKRKPSKDSQWERLELEARRAKRDQEVLEEEEQREYRERDAFNERVLYDMGWLMVW